MPLVYSPVVVDFLDELPIEQLPQYDALLREDELVRMAESYVGEKKLSETERIAREERVPDSTRLSLLNRIAQAYLDDGNLQRAEDLWKTTENYEMLQGPLLKAYKASGNNRKVAELFTLRTQ